MKNQLVSPQHVCVLRGGNHLVEPVGFMNAKNARSGGGYLPRRRHMQVKFAFLISMLFLKHYLIGVI